ncbi:hypothetical protein OAQ99_05115 [Candidatus Kapabacteria bacterium]|nr:hypothetical protein [Candidatus Kapabacteria bacterium]
MNIQLDENLVISFVLYEEINISKDKVSLKIMGIEQFNKSDVEKYYSLDLLNVKN